MIRRELFIFLIVGSLTVLIDFACYRTLLPLIAIGNAKAIGFITGTIFAYIANRFWTFGHHRHTNRSILRFAALYTLTLGINVAANAAILSMLTGNPYAVHVAFMIATFLSAALNFFGMKFFVFAHREAA